MPLRKGRQRPIAVRVMAFLYGCMWRVVNSLLSRRDLAAKQHLHSVPPADKSNKVSLNGGDAQIHGVAAARWWLCFAAVLSHQSLDDFWR